MSRVMTADIPESVKVGLRKVFYSSLADSPKEFRQWANVLKGPDPGGESGRAYIDDLQLGSLGPFAGKPEGDPIQYDALVEGSLVRATPYTWALGTRYTYEAKSDARYGLFERQTKELAGAAAYSMEVQAYRLLNNGFSTTGGTGHTASGFDSLSLFSNSHTLLRGGTGSNRLATDQDLSVTGLELAYDAMSGITSESGTPTPGRARLLIVPYQLRWVAKELTQSELKPYTANNEVNPIAGEFQFMESYYLTDSDSWFLVGEKGMHGLNVWIRETPTYDTDVDFDTKDTKASGLFRMASWHSDWRGAFGSQGA